MVQVMVRVELRVWVRVSIKFRIRVMVQFRVSTRIRVGYSREDDEKNVRYMS